MQKVLNELNESVTRAEGISALITVLCEGQILWILMHLQSISLTI